jgi:hypothetical protein
MRGRSAQALLVAAIGLALAASGLAAASTGREPAARPDPNPHTTWLCRPGLEDNPCLSDLTATVTTATGATRIERSKPAADPPIDCFYVYPTISGQPTVNASLRIDPGQRAVATSQASRFSQVCRVFAPMYRQLTLKAIFNPASITVDARLKAYLGVQKAWRNYLRNYNRGRGVVLIGHSQGARMLTALLAGQIDGNPNVRRRLVSALLIGGHVTVAKGSNVGGSFLHVPICRTEVRSGCVIAYSSFDTEPPPNSFFGRVADPFGGGGDPDKLRIACTNPAALSGGVGALQPYFTTSAPTPWVHYPGLYRARCMQKDGANWLQVDTTGVPGDTRPVVGPSPFLGPGWGLHLYDVGLPLGNLVKLVREQRDAHLRGR